MAAPLGGVINVVTKSGTNNFHGSLYELNRTSATTSNDVEDIALDVPKAKYTRNQFGYSFGGPIIKNKLFFFSTIEWTRIRSNANITTEVPDAAFIAASAPATQAAFAPFTLRSGAIITQKLNATQANAPPDTTGASTADMQAAYAAYAATGGPVFDTVSYKAPSDSGGGEPQNSYNMMHRIDFNITDKTTLYGRYALDSIKESAGANNNSPYAGFDTGATVFNQNMLLSLSHVWSSSPVTETKFNANRLNDLQPLNLAKQPSQLASIGTSTSTAP